LGFSKLGLESGGRARSSRLSRRPADAAAASGCNPGLRGIAFRIADPEWCALVLPRSGLGHKQGLLAWCEANGIDYIFGLPGKSRVVPR
jgi:hypothetical protein